MPDSEERHNVAGHEDERQMGHRCGRDAIESGRCRNLGQQEGPIAPKLIATIRSRMPRNFPVRNAPLVAKAESRRSARTIHGAVSPIAMPPSPAGQAK